MQSAIDTFRSARQQLLALHRYSFGLTTPFNLALSLLDSRDQVREDEAEYLSWALLSYISSWLLQFGIRPHDTYNCEFDRILVHILRGWGLPIPANAAQFRETESLSILTHFFTSYEGLRSNEEDVLAWSLMANSNQRQRKMLYIIFRYLLYRSRNLPVPPPRNSSSKLSFPD